MVTTLVFDNCCCNGLDYLDLSRCASVRRVEVGDHCFRGVEEVKLVGLRELESVLIGKDCFVQDIGGKEATEIATDGSVSADHFTWYPVSRAVGNVKNQGSDIISPLHEN